MIVYSPDEQAVLEALSLLLRGAPRNGDNSASELSSPAEEDMPTLDLADLFIYCSDSPAPGCWVTRNSRW